MVNRSKARAANKGGGREHDLDSIAFLTAHLGAYFKGRGKGTSDCRSRVSMGPISGDHAAVFERASRIAIDPSDRRHR
jgi:hypothetical protein